MLKRFNVRTMRESLESTTIDVRSSRELEETLEWPRRPLIGGGLWIAKMPIPEIMNAVRDVAGEVYNPALRQ